MRDETHYPTVSYPYRLQVDSYVGTSFSWQYCSECTRNSTFDCSFLPAPSYLFSCLKSVGPLPFCGNTLLWIPLDRAGRCTTSEKQNPRKSGRRKKEITVQYLPTTSMSESKACDFLHGEIFFGYFLNASNHLHPWIATTIVMIFLWGIIFYIMFAFDSADFESEEGDDGDGDWKSISIPTTKQQLGSLQWTRNLLRNLF